MLEMGSSCKENSLLRKEKKYKSLFDSEALPQAGISVEAGEVEPSLLDRIILCL